MKKKMFLMLMVIAVLFCLWGTAIAEEDEGVKIRNMISPSLVRIAIGKNVDPDHNGWGTGFFISDKYIVTNHHVISPYYELYAAEFGDDETYDIFWFESALNTEVTVNYSSVGNDSVNGVVVQDWPEVDLAVVEIQSTDAKRTPLKLADEEHVQQGMKIYAAGFPGIGSGSLLDSDNISISSGILSKIMRDSEGLLVTNSIPFLKLSYDSITNPGNSGGPVVDKYGNVIGIHNSSSVNGIGFYGIHVRELTIRLDAAGIKYQKGTYKSDTLLWIIIGVLAAAVIAALILLVTKRGKKTVKTAKPVPTPQNLTGGSAVAVPANASIQGLSGQFNGMKKSLSQTKDTIIGTDPSVCTVVFEKGERGVSGRHCRIHFSKTYQRFIIQDLNSTNGTILVRGSQQRQVPTKTGLALKNGDLIYVPIKNNSFRVNL